MAIYAFAGLRLLPSFQEIYRSINLIKYHYPAYEKKVLNDLNLNNTLFEKNINIKLKNLKILKI